MNKNNEKIAQYHCINFYLIWRKNKQQLSFPCFHFELHSTSHVQIFHICVCVHTEFLFFFFSFIFVCFVYYPTWQRSWYFCVYPKTIWKTFHHNTANCLFISVIRFVTLVCAVFFSSIVFLFKTVNNLSTESLLSSYYLLPAHDSIFESISYIY